jgi:hypothetical protein
LEEGRIMSNGIIKPVDPPEIANLNCLNFIVFGDTRLFMEKEDITEKEQTAFDFLRKQVCYQVARDIANRNADFALFTGDMVRQGNRLEDWDLYWQMRLTDPGIMYPVLGNHEYLERRDDLYQNYFPHLKGYHNYYFTAGLAAFINLCTGDTTFIPGQINRDCLFCCSEVDTIDSFPKQIDALVWLLDNLTGSSNIKIAVINYHKPTYSNFVKHPALKNGANLTDILYRRYIETKRLKRVLIVNGHNHTTEFYKPYPGIDVLVAGGGGAPQSCRDTRTPICTPGPAEIFWPTLHRARHRRISYFTVRIYLYNRDFIMDINEKCYCKDKKGPSFNFNLGFDAYYRGDNYQCDYLRTVEPSEQECDFDRYVNDIPANKS